MLELRNINTYYGRIQVLHDICLHVEQGEIITLIGANGAGKSTILMSISGIVPPRDGEILFNDISIARMPPDKIVALGLSQVPEGRHIFPELTVAENLDMGAFLRKDRRKSARIWIMSTPFFPFWRNDVINPEGTCPAGSSRCWPFPGP